MLLRGVILTVLVFGCMYGVLGLERETNASPEPITIPAIARKAGGSLRQELHQKPNNSETDAELQVGNEDEDYINDFYHDYEEPQCPRKTFYHIRGKKCVPMKCAGGNLKRDKNTGDCLYKEYYGSNSYRYRYNRRPYIRRSLFRVRGSQYNLGPYSPAGMG